MNKNSPKFFLNEKLLIFYNKSGAKMNYTPYIIGDTVRTRKDILTDGRIYPRHTIGKILPPQMEESYVPYVVVVDFGDGERSIVDIKNLQIQRWINGTLPYDDGIPNS